MVAAGGGGCSWGWGVNERERGARVPGAGSSTAASERSLAEQGGAEILTPEEAQLLLTAVGQPEDMQTHSTYQS